MENYLSFYTPDFVFSLAFFIGFLGFGLWWAKDFWPWAKQYLDASRVDSTAIRMGQLDNVRQLTEAVAKAGAELALITELQRHVLQVIQRIEGVKWQD